jgi:hypothetical protein
MSKRFHPKVVTASRLLEGDPVWLTADGLWSPDMAEAELIADPARAEERLALAKSQRAVVTAVELVDAVAAPDGPVPVHFREAFRTRGPSNYPHGKQAQGLRPRGAIPA